MTISRLDYLQKLADSAGKHFDKQNEQTELRKWIKKQIRKEVAKQIALIKGEK